jgi:hypothetical protein
MPRKAAYLRLEANPDEEFDLFLCRELGGMTVAEMRSRMSAAEWLDWHTYYARKAQRAELARLKE